MGTESSTRTLVVALRTGRAAKLGGGDHDRPANHNGAVVPTLQFLREQVMNNTSVHVGQSEIATVVPISELHVIEAE